MSTIRIFVSYDGDHDADLFDLLHAQATRPGAPFAFAACSKGSTAGRDWARDARARIRAVDEVVVICGEHTDESNRVESELRIAQEEDKPYLLLWGRRERMCKMPGSAKRDDVMYSWTRSILESQIPAVLREAKPIEVPAALKRH